MILRFRHQLPAYSPFDLRHLLVAGTAGGRAAHEAGQLLLREYEADDVLVCGSGTQALQAALVLAAETAGSPAVALPAYGCYDLASAAIGAGARVFLYDVDPATLGPDLESVRAAVAAGARTIVAAPLYGVPVDWDALSRLAEAEDCTLIEDAAQGHGALWQGRPLGAWGDLSILSFGRGKGWTCGGGGALFARGRRIPAAAAAAPQSGALRRTAMLLSQWALGRPTLYGIPAGIPALGLGQTVYREPQPPRQASPFAMALIAATHDAALAEAGVRRRNAATLAQHARAAGLLTYEGPPGSTPGYLRLPVRIHGDAQVFAASAGARALGVAAGYPTTLQQLPALTPYLESPHARFAGAETLVRGLITFPTHSRLSASDIVRIADLMRDNLAQELMFRSDIR